MILETWGLDALSSLQSLWGGVAEFLAVFLPAVIFFCLVWFIALYIEKGIVAGFQKSKLNVIMNDVGVEEFIRAIGFRMKTGAFVGAVVRWFFVVVAFVFAMKTMTLELVPNLLSDPLLPFVKSVIGAVLVLLAGGIIASILGHIIASVTQALGLAYGRFLSWFMQTVIWIFTLWMVLLQLQVSASVVNAIIFGFVAMIALAGGIAFGTGGKDWAAGVLKKIHAATK